MIFAPAEVERNTKSVVENKLVIINCLSGVPTPLGVSRDGSGKYKSAMENNLTWTKTLDRDRACGIIIQDGKVLLIHRIRKDREYRVLPGGSVETDETIEEGLNREMREELGIEVKEKRFLFKIENAGRFEHYFIITTYQGEIKEIGGPEKEHMNDENQYIFEWIALSNISDVPNLYPLGVAAKLQEFL
jgi:ADP-ribose pyrophosphatase YjhB (NUDIX family)